MCIVKPGRFKLNAKLSRVRLLKEKVFIRKTQLSAFTYFSPRMNLNNNQDKSNINSNTSIDDTREYLSGLQKSVENDFNELLYHLNSGRRNLSIPINRFRAKRAKLINESLSIYSDALIRNKDDLLNLSRCFLEETLSSTGSCCNKIVDSLIELTSNSSSNEDRVSFCDTLVTPMFSFIREFVDSFLDCISTKIDIGMHEDFKEKLTDIKLRNLLVVIEVIFSFYRHMVENIFDKTKYDECFNRLYEDFEENFKHFYGEISGAFLVSVDAGRMQYFYDVVDFLSGVLGYLSTHRMGKSDKLFNYIIIALKKLNTQSNSLGCADFTNKISEKIFKIVGDCNLLFGVGILNELFKEFSQMKNIAYAKYLYDLLLVSIRKESEKVVFQVEDYVNNLDSFVRMDFDNDEYFIESKVPQRRLSKCSLGDDNAKDPNKCDKKKTNSVVSGVFKEYLARLKKIDESINELIDIIYDAQENERSFFKELGGFSDVFCSLRNKMSEDLYSFISLLNSRLSEYSDTPDGNSTDTVSPNKFQRSDKRSVVSKMTTQSCKVENSKKRRENEYVRLCRLTLISVMEYCIKIFRKGIPYDVELDTRKPMLWRILEFQSEFFKSYNKQVKKAKSEAVEVLDFSCVKDLDERLNRMILPPEGIEKGLIEHFKNALDDKIKQYQDEIKRKKEEHDSLIKWEECKQSFHITHKNELFMTQLTLLERDMFIKKSLNEDRDYKDVDNMNREAQRLALEGRYDEADSLKREAEKLAKRRHFREMKGLSARNIRERNALFEKRKEEMAQMQNAFEKTISTFKKEYKDEMKMIKNSKIAEIRVLQKKIMSLAGSILSYFTGNDIETKNDTSNNSSGNPVKSGLSKELQHTIYTNKLQRELELITNKRLDEEKIYVCRKRKNNS